MFVYLALDFITYVEYMDNFKTTDTFYYQKKIFEKIIQLQKSYELNLNAVSDVLVKQVEGYKLKPAQVKSFANQMVMYLNIVTNDKNKVSSGA